MSANAMKIIPHQRHPNMYRIQWPNGDVSVKSEALPPTWERETYGFYNKTRAVENSKRLGIEDYELGKIYYNPLAR